MIKIQGFGRRSSEMEHAACIMHHREVHSNFGMKHAGDMNKYVLYYFDRAFSSNGKSLHDLPWDMSALEWFNNEDRWNNFLNWLDSDPDGLDVKTDEENFLDRSRSYMCSYNENIIVDSGSVDAVIDVMRLLKLKDDVSPAAAADHHRDMCAPAIAAQFGSSVTKYIANYVIEAKSLTAGRIQDTPVDIIEIYKIKFPAFQNGERFVQDFDSLTISRAEDAIFDRSKTIILTCEEKVYFE